MTQAYDVGYEAGRHGGSKIAPLNPAFLMLMVPTAVGDNVAGMLTSYYNGYEQGKVDRHSEGQQ